MTRASKKKASKNRMIAILDKACRERTVVERDRNECQRCGRRQGEFDPDIRRTTVIQWSHIKGRRYLATRWDDDNSLAHCERCHAWFGNNHILGFDWFGKKFPERWERIKRVLLSGKQTKESDIRAMYQELTTGERQ